MDIGDGYAAIRLGQYRDKDSRVSELTNQQRMHPLFFLVPLLFVSSPKGAHGIRIPTRPNLVTASLLRTVDWSPTRSTDSLKFSPHPPATVTTHARRLLC